MAFVTDDVDDDVRREAWEQRRASRRACQCGDDLPGACPGMAACPYADAPDPDNDA